MPDLATAIRRLKAFRASWNAGDEIDEDSGLTADDLDLVAQAAEDSAKIVQVPRLK